MTTHARSAQPRPLVILHWIARITSLASLGVLLLFLIGESSGRPPHLTPAELFGLLFFPLGISLGMIVGWWRERLGGWIAIASLFGFYVLFQRLMIGRWPRGPWFFIFAAPGILFWFYGLLAKKTTP